MIIGISTYSVLTIMERVRSEEIYVAVHIAVLIHSNFADLSIMESIKTAT